jgi:hypothetical protein
VAAWDTLIVEFRARRVTGTTFEPAREHLGVCMASDSGGVNFFVGENVIYMTSGVGRRGAQVALDTGRMHTYRLEVIGRTARVWVDGSPVLTGTLYVAPEFGPVRRVNWGDYTNFASGTSEWEFFRHNAARDPCASPGPAGRRAF